MSALDTARDRYAAALRHLRRVQRSGNPDALLHAERRADNRRRQLERETIALEAFRRGGGVAGAELRTESFNPAMPILVRSR